MKKDKKSISNWKILAMAFGGLIFFSIFGQWGILIVVIGLIIFLNYKIKKGRQELEEKRGYGGGKKPASPTGYKLPPNHGGGGSGGASGQPTGFERQIDALDAPPIVKKKLKEYAKTEGYSLERLLSSSKVPDVMKKYIRRSSIAYAPSGQTTIPGFDSNVAEDTLKGMFKKKDEPEESVFDDDDEDDDLYQSENYESVQREFTPSFDASDADVIINGKRRKFQNRKNPFEL